MAKDFVSDATAALLAEYAATSYSDTNDESEATLMILPYPRLTMSRPNTWQARNVPSRLVASIAFHSSSDTSRVGVRFVRPAEFTRMSTCPQASFVLRCNSSRLSRFVTSQINGSALPFFWRICSQAVSTNSARRPVGTTFAPARASPLASASPIPEVPPITTAVLSFSSNDGCPISFHRCVRFTSRLRGIQYHQRFQ